MYQLRHYLDMMADEHRMAAHDAALRAVIRPGDVVLDLGAGTGVLTFIALDAGAAHVFAIERSPIIEVARRLARSNALADRITFFQADAREITPPRRVDGIVGDLRGALPLLGDSVDVFEHARARWLKPGGFTVPIEDELRVAPVAAATEYRAVEGWSRPRREARYHDVAALAANRLCRVDLVEDDLLAEDQALGSVHYVEETPRKLAGRFSFAVHRPGVMHGLGLWFRAVLAEGIVLDTSPRSPATVYGQGFLPLSMARPVSPGQNIDVTVAVHRTLPQPTWTWTVASTAGEPWQESHSTFKGALSGQPALDWLTGSKRPALSEKGRVARAVLDAVDGAVTARELAARLVAAFPERFASPDDALPTVTGVLEHYCSS